MEDNILKDSRELQNYLVVSHGGTILATQTVLMKMLDPSDKSPQPIVGRVPNCSLTEILIKLDRKTMKITDLNVKNSTSHLGEQVT